MSKQFSGMLCVYCVSNPAQPGKGDHIFAREFFLKSQRDELPRAPCCKQCNNEKSKLEHYLTTVLPFGASNKEARENLQTMVPRRLARNERLRRELIEKRITNWATDAAGSYHKTFAINVDTQRLGQLCEYIIRGLVWYHWRLYLSEEYFVSIIFPQKIREEVIFRDELRKNGTAKVEMDFGCGTFSYEGSQAIDEPRLTIWELKIYGGLRQISRSVTHEKAFLIFSTTGPKTLFNRLGKTSSEVRMEYDAEAKLLTKNYPLRYPFPGYSVLINTTVCIDTAKLKITTNHS